MGRIRVISGSFKGRQILPPFDARATSDKVKEALFNIFASHIEGATFLDLYAGSGSIGIEAISRGAQHVAFVERNKKNALCIHKNVSLLDCSDRATVFCGTAEEFLKRNENRFDLIYVDPPYDDATLERILPTLASYDTLRSQGVVIVEHFHKRILPDTAAFLFLKRYRYGGTALSCYIYKREGGCLSRDV